MLSFIIPLIYLLMAGTAGTIIFGSKKFGSALPFSLMLHTSIIIISGLLFGDLRTGLYFGILIFAFAIIKAVFADRRGNAIIKAILSVDTLIFCVLYLILFILNSRQVYREATVYQAVQMFMLSLFMPLIGQIEEAVKGKKRIIIELVCTVGVLSSMIILNSCFSFFHIIYTDLPFGLICGFGMAHTYFCDTNKKYSQNLLELIVIMTAIIMTKMMGIIFVPVILVMTWLIFTKGMPVMNKLKIIIPQVMIPIVVWLAYKAESKRYTSISGGNHLMEHLAE